MQPLIGPQRVDLLSADGEWKSGQSKSINLTLYKALKEIFIVVSVSIPRSFSTEITGPRHVNGYIFFYNGMTVQLFDNLVSDNMKYNFTLVQLSITYL